MSQALKDHLRSEIESSKKMYLSDLQAMNHEQLASAPGGVARTPYDMTYEMVVVNERVSQRISGGDPGPWPGGDGFLRAPAEYQDKQFVIDRFSRSMDAVVAALDQCPDERMSVKIALPQGETSVTELCSLIIRHTSYHDGQLNYIQTLHGDENVHWD